MEFIAVIWHWLVACLLKSPSRDSHGQSNVGRAASSRAATEKILLSWSAAETDSSRLPGWGRMRWMSDWLNSSGCSWQVLCLQRVPVRRELRRPYPGKTPTRSRRLW